MQPCSQPLYGLIDWSNGMSGDWLAMIVVRVDVQMGRGFVPRRLGCGSCAASASVGSCSGAQTVPGVR
jgi:hypothetical protein